MGVHAGDHSELLFGRFDPEKFIGDIQWHPVVDKLFWSLRLDDIKYNGIPLNICRGRYEGCMMTPDSGTSLLTAPTWAMEILEEIMPQEENCSNIHKFGTLTYVIDGIDYDLPSHHFMEAYQNVYEPGDKYCMTSISSLDIYQTGQQNLFILGEAFMQMYYSIFDRDLDRVGLAKSKIYHSEHELAQLKGSNK
jgi:hypothetical protein